MANDVPYKSVYEYELRMLPEQCHGPLRLAGRRSIAVELMGIRNTI